MRLTITPELGIVVMELGNQKWPFVRLPSWRGVSIMTVGVAADLADSPKFVVARSAKVSIGTVTMGLSDRASHGDGTILSCRPPVPSHVLYRSEPAVK